MHTGNIPYLDFIAPGILAAERPLRSHILRHQRHLERDLGITAENSSPARPRAQHSCWAKASPPASAHSAGPRRVWSLPPARGESQLEPLALLNVIVVVVLAATLFSTFSLIIACMSRRVNASWASARFSPCRFLCKPTRYIPPTSCPLAEDRRTSQSVVVRRRCAPHVHAFRYGRAHSVWAAIMRSYS